MNSACPRWAQTWRTARWPNGACSRASAIQRGEVVALVETAKGIIDIESYEDGVVERLLVEPGARVPVGAPLALLAGDATAGAGGPAPAPGTRAGTRSRARCRQGFSRRPRAALRNWASMWQR